MRGRDTAPSALAAVALAVLLAATLYAIPARRGKGRVLANPLPVGGLLLLVSAAFVSITTSAHHCAAAAHRRGCLGRNQATNRGYRSRYGTRRPSGHVRLWAQHDARVGNLRANRSRSGKPGDCQRSRLTCLSRFPVHGLVSHQSRRAQVAASRHNNTLRLRPFELTFRRWRRSCATTATQRSQ